jgi:preprotein translocase SecE subunit
MLNYLKGVGREFKNIKWPTTKTTIYYTVGVIAISAIFILFIWVSDKSLNGTLDKALYNQHSKIQK